MLRLCVSPSIGTMPRRISTCAVIGSFRLFTRKLIMLPPEERVVSERECERVAILVSDCVDTGRNEEFASYHQTRRLFPSAFVLSRVPTRRHRKAGGTAKGAEQRFRKPARLVQCGPQRVERDAGRGDRLFNPLCRPTAWAGTSVADQRRAGVGGGISDAFHAQGWRLEKAPPRRQVHLQGRIQGTGLAACRFAA